MRRLLLMAFWITVSVSIKGHVARWLIPNVYDNIYIAQGASVIITDSAEHKILWGFNGRKLARTTDHIFSFMDNCAIAVQPNTPNIKGFFRPNGEFIGLKNCTVAHAYPYFSNDYLLVLEDNYYRFSDQSGKLSDSKYIMAYPFSNGYASCKTYENMEKSKNPYNLLLNKELEAVRFSYEGKSFDADDIDFISSVNDENIGFVVIKRKVYLFNGLNKSLSPVFANKDDINIKNQAKLPNDIQLCWSNETDTTSILNAKSGKSGFVRIRFNNFYVPTAIIRNDSEYKYKFNKKIIKKQDSPLKYTMQNNLFGLNWEDIEVLPPQFNKVGQCFGNKAFVKLKGKFGMLEVLEDKYFSITLNKENDIAFKHQKFEAKLRMNLPSIISAHKSYIDIKPETGCQVDMTSRYCKDTEAGNYVDYDCILSIPHDLPDDINDPKAILIYPAQIKYDGLLSPVINIKKKAWHYKYFTADVNESERTFQNELLSFTFDINAQWTAGDEAYPKKATVLADSLEITPDKISETRYRCRDLNIKEGINNIIIKIQEQGCPPMYFPYEITYTRPSAKNKANGSKGGLVIRKKEKSTTNSKKHIEMKL